MSFLLRHVLFIHPAIVQLFILNHLLPDVTWPMFDIRCCVCWLLGTQKCKTAPVFEKKIGPVGE